MAIRTPNRQSETAILEIVRILRRRLRRLFLKAREKNRNIPLLGVRVP
jgi:hypothetical protein